MNYVSAFLGAEQIISLFGKNIALSLFLMLFVFFISLLAEECVWYLVWNFGLCTKSWLRRFSHCGIQAEYLEESKIFLKDLFSR